MAPSLNIDIDKANAQSSKCPVCDESISIGHRPRSYINYVYGARHGGRAPPSQVANAVKERRSKDIAVPQEIFFLSLSSPEKRSAASSGFPEPKVSKRTRLNALREQTASGAPTTRPNIVREEDTTDIQAHPGRERIAQCRVTFFLPSHNDTDVFPIPSSPTTPKNEFNSSPRNLPKQGTTNQPIMARAGIQETEPDEPVIKIQQIYPDKDNH